MRAEGAYALCSEREEQVGGFGDGACGVHYVVDEDYVLALDVADNGHFLHDVGFGALFVAEHQGHVEVFCVAVGTLGTADVGRGDYHVFEVEALDEGDEDRRCIEMVDGNIEESLDLVGVEVHGYEAVDACGAKQVGNQLGGDGDTRFVLAVLAGPAEVRDYCNDGGGGSALGGVDHQ